MSGNDYLPAIPSLHEGINSDEFRHWAVALDAILAGWCRCQRKTELAEHARKPCAKNKRR